MPNDLDKLQGTWRIVSMEVDGATQPGTVFPDAAVTVSKNRFVSRGMGDEYEGTVTLDPKRTPRRFDVAFTKGPPAGQRQFGIYKITKDGWMLCLGMGANLRPRSFATKPGSGFVLETFARGAVLEKARAAQARAAKRTTPAQARAAVDGPPSPIDGAWTMVSAVMNGVAMSDDMVKWVRRETVGAVTTVLAGPQVMLKATFAIDESLTPAGIDYVNLAGSNEGKVQYGIIEWRGDDLKICMAPPGKPRPKDFASTKGDGRSFTTWRKA